MKKGHKADVVLIGYEDQENLGLRSIKAYLDARNQPTVLVPFRPGEENQILAVVKDYNPLIVGFSFIFQYTLDDFGKLATYLRKNKVDCHFTAGGHFPSLEPKVTFEEVPELDSIVRFEGEITLSELIDKIDQPLLWAEIEGLAYKKDGEAVINPPRPLITNLDELPFIYRDYFVEVAGGIRAAFMLASRGCLYNCSFCSIRQFYRSAPGPLRRTRSAGNVAEEMTRLYSKHDVRFFSFQDDDFANRSIKQKQWLRDFMDEIDKRHLKDKIRWKISCRVDDLNPESLEMMISYGLIAVYLGIESGNDEGLKTLNKGVNVEQNLYAVNLLKTHNIAMSAGFMLFDPSSDIESLRKNINFLRVIGQDGYFPVNFCKMLPYAGTPAEQQLTKEGRLKGSKIQPDYGFNDPLVNWYYFIVNRIFSRRNFKPDGLVSLLQSAEFEYRLQKSFNPNHTSPEMLTKLHELIARANLHAVNTLDELLDLITSSDVDYLLKEKNILLRLIEKEWQEEVEIERQLVGLKNQLVYI